MLSLIKSVLKGCGVDTTKLYQALSAASVEAAAREQGLVDLRSRLRHALPDVSDQYTTGFDPLEYQRYWEPKMRGLHTFQVQCMLDAIEHIGGDNLTLVDIGDSSGNHAAYLKALIPMGKVDRVISVNQDPVAVDKVNSKGGEAVLCRAEELNLQDFSPDLFLSFETVEHLSDPVRFLHDLSARGSAEYLLFSVPYCKTSRFGGQHLRQPEATMPSSMTPEEVHIFELSPADWQLMTRFAGYKTIWNRTYWQYPRAHPLRLMAPLWRKLDFEGFIVLLLKRDLCVAERYSGW